MKLNYRDTGAGFILEFPDIDKYDRDRLHDEYSGEVGDQVLSDDKGEVVFYSLIFKDEEIDDLLNFEIEAVRDIQGQYSVLELGLQNVPFTEVLKAVKDYCLEKFNFRRSVVV